MEKTKQTETEKNESDHEERKSPLNRTKKVGSLKSGKLS
jgi:hypothetical protein